MPDLNATTEVLTIVYSITDLINVLGVGRTHLYCQINSGALSARKVGRRTLVLHEDLQNYLRNLPVIGK